MRKPKSLRLRLFALAAAVMAVAMVTAGFGLTALFTRHLERRVGQELDTHLQLLAGGLRIDEAGALSLRANRPIHAFRKSLAVFIGKLAMPPLAASWCRARFGTETSNFRKMSSQMVLCILTKQAVRTAPDCWSMNGKFLCRQTPWNTHSASR